MGKLDFYEAEDRPWPNPRLTTASIVGHTTPTSTRIWVRVVAPGVNHLYVGVAKVDSAQRPRPLANAIQLDAGGQSTVHPGFVGSHAFAFRTDLTHVFDVAGLRPDTTYFYALFRDADKRPWEMGAIDTLSFRTPAEDPAELSFGLCSCHMPYKGDKLQDVSLWDALADELRDARAAYVVGMGDQVYADGTPSLDIWRWLRKVKSLGPTDEDMRSWYRDIYRGYWGIAGVRKVFRSFPTYMMWDDHEIKDGWGSYTDAELSDELDRFFEWEDQAVNLALANRMRSVAAQIYQEYQHCHNPPTPADIWHYAFAAGRSATFVLDGRGHRHYESNASTSVLGPKQLQDLRAWFDRLDAKTQVAFVVSPVPIVHLHTGLVNNGALNTLNPAGIVDDLRDQWEHASHHAERKQLLDILFAWSHRTGRRVVVLSGDVHAGTAFRLSAPAHPKARVHQITSSGISYASTPPGLELVAASTGTVAGAGAVRFNRTLDPFTRNNFAIVRVRFAAADGDPWVAVDFYGRDPGGEGVLKLRRLEI